MAIALRAPRAIIRRMDPDVAPDDAWWLGTWRLLRADPTLDLAPGIRMEFREHGELRYHIDVGGRDQVIVLRYRVEGGVLSTENPAHPHRVHVQIWHGAGDILRLDFGGAEAMLIRESSRSS
jgi:hypothetical protein